MVDTEQEDAFVGVVHSPEYFAFMNKKYRREKQAYVDAKKREIGRCQNPDCPCDGPSKGVAEKGYEVCLDFDHIRRSEKRIRIAALVNNNLSFKTAKPLMPFEEGEPLKIQAEIDL